ncbi:hypothetical protein [Actinoallomurus sp. NPDC050550]|uniref:hypothetical protein n=1 Tax=Actinoallomurus sp. NPDC050550 TaxID=3154937 RepID=UPI0033C0977C
MDGVTGTPDEVFTELKQGMGGTSGMDMGSSASPSSCSDDSMGDMGRTGMGDSASPSASASSGGMPPKFMLMGATSKLLGGDAGDVKYPHHLINGRVASDPDVYTGRPGRKVRLRIINAGSDTAYRVALGGHKLTITHTDGFPVEHQEVDALLVGSGTTSSSPSATASSRSSPWPRARTRTASHWCAWVRGASRLRPSVRRSSTA